MALLTALRACGVVPSRFHGRLVAAAPPAPLPRPPSSAQQTPSGSGGLWDVTNLYGGGGASNGSSGGCVAVCAVPAHQLAALRDLAPAAHVYPPQPPRPPHEQRQQSWQRAVGPPPPHQRPVGPPPPPPLPSAALLGLLPVAGGGGPLSISDYTALARQLQHAAAQSMSAPLPVLVTADPQHAVAGPGSAGMPPAATQEQVPPPPTPSTSTDPAHLQAILQALLTLKLESTIAAGQQM